MKTASTTLHPFVCLNGAIIPREYAYISPDDRGFKFGDGLFETIAVVNQQPYLWNEHVTRLGEGLDTLKIQADLSALRSLCTTLITKNAMHDGALRLMITRGTGSQGYLPTHISAATIYIETMPATRLGTAQAAISLAVSTWKRFAPDTLPTHTKIMQGMNATLARLEAAEQGCDEALMLSTDDMICEAASGNLFWLEGDILCTPPLTTGCLAGTMRARLLDLWQGECAERSITLEQLTDYNALIMTNAVRGAVPIRTIHTATQEHHFTQSEVFAQQCQRLIEKDIAQMLTNA